MAEANMNQPISLLFLSPKWQYDTYGVASVVRSLVNDMWLMDPDGQKIQMTCAVLQEDGKINEADVADAAKHNVKLRGVKLPRGIENIPTLQEINGTISTYYTHLALKQRFDFIVGHIPYLTNGALNFQDLCEGIEKSSNVILLAHALPRTKENDIDESTLTVWLKDARIVFSIGGIIKSEIQAYINCLEEEERPVHYSYIPGCPAEFLTVLQEKRTNPLRGPQNITMMTTEQKNLKVSGLNYQLAVASSTLASPKVHELCEMDAKVQFLLLANNTEERKIWEESFDEIKQRQQTRDKRMAFQFQTFEDTKKLKSLMKRVAVMILPLKPDSSLFGVEALMAAYSGVPILVSSNSGIASLMNSMGEGEAIVYNTTGTLQNDSKVWSEKIYQKISDPQRALNLAESLRGSLLLDTSIAASHVEFIKIITDAHNYELKIELDTEGSVLSESLATAKRFGVKCEGQIQSNIFLAAYLTKILLQREKLDLGVLDSYIPQDVKEAWREFLSCLEQTKRKLLGVSDGSLSFTLFCPTAESYKQLLQETWRNQLTEKLENLLSVLGISVFQLTIAEPKKEEALLSLQTRTLPAFSRLSLQDGEESSGYGTLPPDPLDQMSLIQCTTYVEDWLKEVDPGQVSSTESVHELTKRSEWNLVDVIRTGYDCGSGIWFSVGESGNIGILFSKSSPDKTTLSVLYPPTCRRVTLCEYLYDAAVSIKLLGRECLAALRHADASIHLWDIENWPRSRVVYRKGTRCGGEPMVLCAKDNDTVVYGEYKSTCGVHTMHLLNTSTELWSLRATLELQTGLEFVVDMCCMQMADGTACMLLCNSVGHTRSVAAVEMLGGNIQWRLGVEQMGERFTPVSVCTDSDHNVYVSDVGHHRVYMLSPEDGSVIATVLNAQQHGINYPFCVQIQSGHLYVAHLNNSKKEKWVISRFVRE